MERRLTRLDPTDRTTPAPAAPRASATSQRPNAEGDVVLVIDGGQIIGWNIRTRHRHLLSFQAVKALTDEGYRKANPAIEVELRRADLLVDTPDVSAPGWGWNWISRAFHLGTRNRRPLMPGASVEDETRAYVEYCTSIMPLMPTDAFATNRGTGDLDVAPGAVKPIEGLLKILGTRVSNRTFGREPLDFGALCTVVDETFRYRAHDLGAYAAMGMETPTSRRSSPSAGSLQACEAYVVALNVASLAGGVYHYRSHARTLGFIAALDKEFSIGDLLSGQMFADDLGAALVITCRFDKLMWKYKDSRAYRAALLDAGHLSQTAQLVATGLGLRTWVTAEFYDEELGWLLGVDETAEEHPLLVVGLGTGAVNPFDRDLGDGFGRHGDQAPVARRQASAT